MSIIPMLAVHDAAAAISFYQSVFGATEANRMVTEDGKTSHAEIRVGDARFMVADEFPEHNTSADTLGGTPVILYITVDDALETVNNAVAAGAAMLREVAAQPHGDLVGKIKDPFGHVWMIAEPLKTVPQEK
ncbi:VOC family protein [Paenibacillus cellulositrophicus]|uniref:VOC family protein n=1 Tax=Paenibacillus cellulositrophicus TaxID=562959 RepID=UPI0012677D08|nr:VOC family protein [Paenibacillus cellulositrophicus]